ncbi:hypothetical protein DEAC_c40330 [Desulfosporosinus acididurans]|uniref:Uncharacterized protein n=1 Tax=Desulfosporosinus acididurans TaxID=476652 RepID=A0A0J1FKP2_9FIRM|nr:hypothetical protein [Desulfosporosinus acididurans]KLU64039.1 hypothetical protein DEAC_c40330 [Desulfosporosinus acididurans]
MKHLLVLNGEYYAVENKEENKLVFLQGRNNAVAVDERRLRYLLQTIQRWFMSGEIELKRIEVLKVV